MYFLFSGEGVTDLGECANSAVACEGNDYQPGPMAVTEEGFARGVPMIPKPSSEAWLLCALREHPYQGCAALENRSGSPHSPHSLKGELEKRLGRPPTREELCEMVINGRIDHRRIDMPSFNAFQERLEAVL